MHVLFAGTADGEFWMWKIPGGACKTYQSHGPKTTCSSLLKDGRFNFIPNVFALSLCFDMFCPFCCLVLCIDLKIDNLDRVSVPTKIMATFDVEHPIHGTTYGV